jgi:hypothetical protein
MKKVYVAFLSLSILLSACDMLKNVTYDDVEKILEAGQGSSPKALTNAEVVNGLKEALNIGTQNAVNMLSKENGFFKDPILKIPFPQEAQFVADKLRQVGLGDMVDNFELKMNRGAEAAVKKAVPIFTSAITSMSIQDAMGILKGNDNAATNYFKDKTSTALFNAFSPQVQGVLDQMEITKYWTDLTAAYNKLPFSQKVETDLTKYVTNKAMDGLFVKIENEEKAIRENPAARVTDILKRVFGSLDQQ